jgi:hypothetical protein
VYFEELAMFALCPALSRVANQLAVATACTLRSKEQLNIVQATGGCHRTTASLKAATENHIHLFEVLHCLAQYISFWRLQLPGASVVCWNSLFITHARLGSSSEQRSAGVSQISEEHFHTAPATLVHGLQSGRGGCGAKSSLWMRQLLPQRARKSAVQNSLVCLQTRQMPSSRNLHWKAPRRVR